MNSICKDQSDIIYGINPAFEVLRAGRRPVRRAWLAAGAADSPRLRKLAEMLAAAGAPVERVNREVVARHCRSPEHQGVALETAPYPYAPLTDLLAARRLLLLDNVEDPQNVGAILRSAEVFGWSNVLLANKGVPEIYASVVKASAGATEHLNICRECTANGYARQALAAGFQLLALDSKGRDDLTRIAGARLEKILLVIGGEHHAVGQYILNQAQYVVGIPQRGKTTSLNASVAAGIALFLLGG